MTKMLTNCSVAFGLLAALGRCQTTPAPSCSPTLTASYPSPSVADGYVARLVANDLSSPRSIKFDSQGALLVVEANSGIVALSLVDAGQDCVSVGSRKTVVNNTALTHGIELSPNGDTLYASSADTLWSWDYSASSQTNTSAPRVLIENMSGTDHTTRTLLLSKFAPGLMVVCRGSTSNIDFDAADITTGHSQIKAFNLTNLTNTYDFTSDGLLLGWGLRNEVGIAEEPTQGGIYGVENSADQISRLVSRVNAVSSLFEIRFSSPFRASISIRTTQQKS